ncbi:MAG TPA: PmoA family protein [bacterium]|nr:PmoA family protein [bacterium]
MTARCWFSGLWLLIVVPAWAQEKLPNPRPVPACQVIPLPYDQASFQCEGEELTRYHYGPGLRRPFWYPVIGPSGIPLTRMGHPHDQQSHKHHNSVWISHNSVNGVDFWADTGTGKIMHRRIAEFEDGGREARTVTENDWLDESTGQVLMRETRTATTRMLKNGEWLLIIDLILQPDGKEVVLGQSPFGLIGVRMAKTIGVNDGGGMIRNSEGNIDEKEVFWKKAQWVDYSGPVTNEAVEGITLFDHPGNPNYPANFHVRNDGWMGASLTHEATRVIQTGEKLTLRYGLYIHRELKPLEEIGLQWKEFAGK